MPSRTQITLDASLDRRAKERARDLGLSFAEYVRRVISQDLESSSEDKRSDISNLAGIGDSGGSDVGAHKDAYLDEALGA